MGQEAPRDLLMFVDTETSGVPVDQTASYKNIDNWPRIKQISWLIYDKEEQLYASHNYVISDEDASTQINSPEYVPKTVLPIHQVLKRFLNFLRYCNVIVGHNIQYDIHVILSELYRYGMDTDKLSSMQHFCTMQNGVRACGFETGTGERYPKLQELYSKLFHQPFENAHDAYCDIKATADCFWALFSKGVLNKADFPFLLTTQEQNSIVKQHISDGVDLVMAYVNRGCRVDDESPLKALLLFDKALQQDPSPYTKDSVGKACLKCAREMYSGGGMPVSFRFFQKAADTGYPEALAAQAVFENNKEEKKKLLLKAVEKGWMDAAHSLYFIYKKEGDDISAKRFSTKWMSYCEDNFDSLRNDIATSYIRCYLFGEFGVPANYAKAESLCLRSIAKGVDNYKLYAKLLELSGEWEKRFEILNESLNAYKKRNSAYLGFRLPFALQKQPSYYDKHARDSEYVRRIIPLVECYFEGLGTEKDYKKAKEMIDNGLSYIWADNGDRGLLHFYRGRIFENGLGGFPINLNEAFHDYKAASDYYAEAQRKVGIMYLEGKGCARDKKLARLYLEGAKSKGLDVSPYLEKAKSWF